MANRQYSPEDCSLQVLLPIIGTVQLLQEYPDGSFLTVSQRVTDFSRIVDGCDGEVVTVSGGSPQGTIAFSCGPFTTASKVMRGLAAFTAQGGKTDYQVVASTPDGQFIGLGCTVSRYPTRNYTTDSPGFESWQFVCGRIINQPITRPTTL